MSDIGDDGFSPAKLLQRLTNPPPVVSVLRLSGLIADGAGAIRGGALSHTALAPAIARAFSGKRLAAVALQVNSPGGSPVQSALIANQIRRAAAKKGVPVLTFVEDLAASGGYWLALAGDEIYADASSIVGSIGVISAGFGLTGLIDKLGVERRVHTSGENKSFLDPFRPESPTEVDRLKQLQSDIHDNFIKWVKERRGAKLTVPDEPSLFSGAFWTGTGALERGLIDGLGDMGATLRARFGDEVRLRFVNLPRRGWLARRLGLDLSLAEDLAHTLDARAARARFGM